MPNASRNNESRPLFNRCLNSTNTQTLPFIRKNRTQKEKANTLSGIQKYNVLLGVLTRVLAGLLLLCVVYFSALDASYSADMQPGDPPPFLQKYFHLFWNIAQWIFIPFLISLFLFVKRSLGSAIEYFLYIIAGVVIAIMKFMDIAMWIMGTPGPSYFAG